MYMRCFVGSRRRSYSVTCSSALALGVTACLYGSRKWTILSLINLYSAVRLWCMLMHVCEVVKALTFLRREFQIPHLLSQTLIKLIWFHHTCNLP